MKTKQIKKMKVMYPGKVTDTHNNTYDWTTDDFKLVVANFTKHSPEKMPPILLSHEVKGKPRYGHVENVWVDESDGCLYASAQVTEQLFEACKGGKFPNRSISVFVDSKKIRHLAILGAEAPAYDDLGLAEFSENSTEATADFSIYLEIIDGDVLGALEEEKKRVVTAHEKRIAELEKAIKNCTDSVLDMQKQQGVFAEFMEGKQEATAEFTKKLFAEFSSPLPKSNGEERTFNAVGDLSKRAAEYAKQNNVTFMQAVYAVKGEEQ